MAGNKAHIDKDSNEYLSKGARPAAERETAYHSTNDLEGTTPHADRDGNGDDVFKGAKIKKDTSRKQDQKSSGTSGDMGSGLQETETVFSKVLARRFGIQESENPGVASSPSTSDSPSLGMNSVSTNDFKQSRIDVKSLLEGIALQAAETYEMLDDNKAIPDALSSELQNCAKVVDKLYEMMSKDQSPDGSGTADQAAPTQNAEKKPSVNEDLEDLDEKLIGNQKKIDVNHNGKLDAQDFKTLRAKKTMKEATVLVFNKLLSGDFE